MNFTNSDEFRKYGHQLIDLLADHLALQTSGKGHCMPYMEADDLYEKWSPKLAEGYDRIEDFWQDVLAHSISLHNPKYIGHQVNGPAYIGALGGLMASYLNNGGAVYEMGMAMTIFERFMIEQIASKAGLDDKAEGFFTSGGTLANLSALLAARQKAFAQFSDPENKKWAVMVSEQSHYSVDRAAKTMGWGNEGIIHIPVDDRCKMRTDLLEEQLRDARANDIEVVAVVGSACTTSTGSFDDLEAIADFCQKHDLWFHVDAAHGGANMFSKKLKPIIKGIEKADSFIFDFHKLLLTPALATAVIFKNGEDSYRAFTERAAYLLSDEKDWYNLGKRTYECTKNMMILKVMNIWFHHGPEQIEAYLDKIHRVTKEAAQWIDQQSDFEVALSPESNILCFRYLPGEESKANEANLYLREKILQEGEFYIVKTVIKGKHYLRTTLLSPLTELSHFQELITKIRELSIPL